MPQVSSISPSAVRVGTAALTLTVTGSNFSSASVVQWNATALTTAYLDTTQLTAQVPAANFFTSGTAQITVLTPGATAGTSNVQTFTVQGASPSISSISPTSATAGSAAFTLTATGTLFDSKAQIQWNGAALSTTYVSSTQLTAQVPATDIADASSAQVTVVNPGTGGGQSGPLVFYINSAATKLQTIAANANQLIWDGTRRRIYATLAHTNNGANNDTVAVINPVTATIDATTPAGTSPNLLALSSDSSYLWVSDLANGNNVAARRFALPNLTPDITIPVPQVTSVNSGPVLMQAAPDNPHTVAMSFGSMVGGTIIYDDATPRPIAVNEATALGVDFDWLQWGADSTTLYGGSLGIPTNMYQMAVNSSGVNVTANRRYAVPASSQFDSQTGLLYSDAGEVVNPKTFGSVGNYDLTTQSVFTGNPHCAVDSSQGLVFFMGEFAGNALGTPESGYAIQVFDQKTFRLLRTLQLPQFEGTPVGLIRWGNAGLAFNVVPLTYQTANPATGTIYLIDGAFINGTATPDFTSGTSVQPLPAIISMSPQSTTAGSAATTLTVDGNNFENGSVVYLGRNPLQTTFVNAGQLQATIPSSSLQAAGTNFVSISNGDGSSLSVNNLTFTTLPSGSSYSPVNLSAYDLAWDSRTGLLYAAVMGYDTQYPNTIAGIDPSAGKVVSTQFVGSDPFIVRATSDGSYLYAAPVYGGTVSRLSLPTLSPVLTWSLGTDNVAPNYVARDIQPVPGAPQTVAIATYYLQYNQEWFNYGDQNDGGVFIYDNSVQRSTPALETFANGDNYFGVQWGNDASTLYSWDSSYLYSLNVSASGVVRNSKTYGVFTSGNYPKASFDPGTGFLYDDQGRALDPATGKVVGNFNSSGLVVSDSSLGRVFILGEASSNPPISGYTITAFDQKTYAGLRSITIPSVVGVPVKMVRWGTSGLAFVTYQNSSNIGFQPWGMLYIINDPVFVSAKQRSSEEPAPQMVQKTWSVPLLPVRNGSSSTKSAAPH